MQLVKTTLRVHQSIRCLHLSPAILQRSEDVIKLNDPEKIGRDKRTRKLTFGSICMLIVPATALSLGVWQIYRLRWKNDLIADLKTKLKHKAVEFPTNNLDALENMEYRRIKAKGRFLYDREFVIAPRGRFDEAYDDRMDGGLIGNPTSSSHGGHFITPFQLNDSDIIIMVNRGWLPQNKLNEEKRRRRPDNIVELEAIVRKTEKQPRFISKNIPEKDAWFYKDFEQMAQKCGALPIYVEAVYDPKSKEGPIGGQTNVNIQNNHLSYMLTWFTLSAVTMAMWFVRYMRPSI